jgi:uncharacterized damage-inducible protein DinB
MDALRHVRLMADYNRWTNRQLYAAAGDLSPVMIAAETGAQFGSIMVGLSHQVADDALWLRRFGSSGHFERLMAAGDWLPAPAPASLREPVCADLVGLTALRDRIDELITGWCADLIFKDLDRVMVYRTSNGLPQQHQLGPLLSHFFNHQTHYRGQISTLLHQAGVQAGPSELVGMPGFNPFSPLDGNTAPGDQRHPTQTLPQSRSSIQAC